MACELLRGVCDQLRLADPLGASSQAMAGDDEEKAALMQRLDDNLRAEQRMWCQQVGLRALHAAAPAMPSRLCHTPASPALMACFKHGPELQRLPACTIPSVKAALSHLSAGH